MTLKTPLWQQDSSYSATLDRELIDALFPGQGIIVPTDLLVAQRAAGANMSVDVAAGSCVVTGTDATGQGKYLCKSDAITNVVIATAPGTGNSRIDKIVATVRDQDQNGLAHNDWIIQAVTGTAVATGSQVAPATPASSLLLATIAVGPNVSTIVTANITDNRTVAGETSNTIATSQTTSSASFTDLATVGPVVSLVTGTRALVILTAQMSSSVINGVPAMGFAVSGASTIAAAAAASLFAQVAAASQLYQLSAVFPVTLTPGVNTFTAKYEEAGAAGTATFVNRSMIVIPLP